MIKFILLGIIQGLTEFLPVSSSGHLVVAQKLFGMQTGTIAVSVVLHLGTVLSLLVFFFRDILKLFRDLKSVMLIGLITLITGVIGLSGKDFFEKLFSSPKLVAFSWFITAGVLFFAARFMQAKREKVSFKDAFILGITQGIAIVPGISRSGITVSTLLFRGISKEESFRFSFLAAIPAIMGAALLELKDISCVAANQFGNVAAGFLASFVFGLFALWLFRQALKKAKLQYFAYYCIILAIITLLFV
ncbi:MAG: undecaprenyl-diphosphate phosphatase [Candidatus Omnitrophica bacterium]|nr:undecaprenyl-diphosphate phosphatase [Candidatus Omnitrophota bacterium]